MTGTAVAAALACAELPAAVAPALVVLLEGLKFVQDVAAQIAEQVLGLTALSVGTGDERLPASPLFNSLAVAAK